MPAIAHVKALIGGARLSVDGQTFETVDPYRHTIVARVDNATKEVVARAVAAATAAKPVIAATPARERAALLKRIVARAHVRGMRVVGWYLPQFLDVGVDIRRMSAIAGLGMDGIGIDIESTDNPNVADRTDKLLAEVRFLRLLHPDVPMAAIPVTPVIWEQLNRSWWPNFPYRELSNYVDAWMPMAYWSYRRAGSFPEWGDPAHYVVESVTRLRVLTGRPNLPVHPIGGEGTDMSVDDARAMAWAVAHSRSIGGSIYDDRTTPPSIYPTLAQMRREQVK